MALIKSNKWLIIIFTLFSLHFTANGQQIRVSQAIVDLGLIEEGQVYTAEYEIINESNEVVEIRDAISTCGCTVPKWENVSIAPKQRYFLNVQFDSTDKKGIERKKIVVVFNNFEEVHLALLANIQ